jgi:hypothetical protein
MQLFSSPDIKMNGSIEDTIKGNKKKVKMKQV